MVTVWKGISSSPVKMNGTQLITPTLLCGLLLATMLVTAGITDLKSRTIPNLLNAAIALLAPLAWWVAGLHFWPEIAIQVGMALAVFTFFAILFALGQMGGGDVKLIGALTLWIAPGLMLNLLMIMAIVGGVIAGAMLIRQKIQKSTAIPEVPYGVAIAVAGIWAICQQYINHFPLISTL